MINLIVLASLISTGVFVCTREGMILSPLVAIYNKVQSRHCSKFLEFIRNPMFDCLYCQGSVYGALTYIIAMDTITIEVIPMMFATCGLNTIIAEITRKFWE